MASSEPTSLLRFFNDLSQFAGTVAFATVMVMLCLDQYKAAFRLKHTARWMVYFDVLAWIVAYAGLMVKNDLSPCQQTYFWFAADLIWAFKDGFKYTYIVYRCTRISGSTDRRPSIATFVISVALYFLYMARSYNFSGDCSTANTSGHVTINWAVILLYGVWMLIDIVASVIMIRKLTHVVRDVAYLPGRMAVYTTMIIREEARLLLATLAMGIVTILATINVFNPGATAPLSAITFVYVQLLLYMNSIKIQPPSAGSERGQSRHPASTSAFDSQMMWPGSPTGKMAATTFAAGTYGGGGFSGLNRNYGGSYASSYTGGSNLDTNPTRADPVDF
ncbi:hypothetical protein HK104_000732 [Borealophlyctis nickersoniae]|nr:hypothetical protein HK104_000732 [Borealophlyctis nickersoniae]